MRQAAKIGAPFPPANWLFVFKDFRDVVRVLISTLGVGTKLRKRALQENLLWELTANLQRLVSKREGQIYPHHRELCAYRDLYRINLEGVLSLQTPSRDDARRLGVYALLLPYANSLSQQALMEAINSGEFLDYDSRTDRFVVGKLQQAMLTLRDEIESLKHQYNATPPFKISKEVSDYADGRTDGIRGPTIASLYGMSDRLYNIVKLAAALLAFFRGNESALKLKGLKPEFPIEKAASESTDTSCSPAEIERWVQVVTRGN